MYFYSLLSPLRATTIAVAIVGKTKTVYEAIQKRSHEPQKLKQRNQERQLCYRKIGRAITKWGAIEKS